MTTVVADTRKGIIVGDNQCTVNASDIISTCRKVYKIKKGPNKGHVLGFAGHECSGLVFLEWYTSGKPPEKIDIDWEDEKCDVLIITPKGEMFMADQWCILYPMEEPYMAIGSGAQVAMGALDAGATAEEAIDIACERDVYTSLVGRPMQKEHVDKTKGKSK